MKKVKKALLAVGAVTVVTGITVALKKLYDDYHHFVDFEVDDIALEDAPKLYAESRLNSLKEKIDNMGNEDSSEDNEDGEDDFLSEDEFWDDNEEDFLESEDDLGDDSADDSADDSVVFYDDEDEDDDYSFADVEEEPREKTDFEKVCGITREEAIKVILSHNKSHSEELLDVLEDASLAEIYSSLK